MQYSFILLAAVCRLALAAPTHIFDDLEIRARTKFPFNKIIAFGDDLTDNGQGSYEHGITGDPKTGAGKALWGANTWTDGPVSVSYLADNLNMPLKYDYAFGSAGGAQFIGSVCGNSLLDKTKLSGHAKLLDGKVVPDALSQIKNYTSSHVFNKKIKKTLHFLWTGNNDMIASLGWSGRFTICSKDTLCHAGQQAFLTKLLGCMNTSLTNLLQAGAQHILVPNVYPRHLSPWASMWISQDPAMLADFGNVITQYNTQLQASIAALNEQYDANIMYYDAFGFLQSAMNNSALVQGAQYTNTCVDGCDAQIPGNVSNWDLYWKNTVVNKQPDDFFWMTEVMPSTTVMKGLAQDMLAFLKSQF